MKPKKRSPIPEIPEASQCVILEPFKFAITATRPLEEETLAIFAFDMKRRQAFIEIGHGRFADYLHYMLDAEGSKYIIRLTKGRGISIQPLDASDEDLNPDQDSANVGLTILKEYPPNGVTPNVSFEFNKETKELHIGCYTGYYAVGFRQLLETDADVFDIRLYKKGKMSTEAIYPKPLDLKRAAPEGAPPAVTNIPPSVTNTPPSVTNTPPSVTNTPPSVTLPTTKKATPEVSPPPKSKPEKRYKSRPASPEELGLRSQKQILGLSEKDPLPPGCAMETYFIQEEIEE